MDELVKDLTLDMISEGLYRMIAEAIGTDNFYKLAEIVTFAIISGATVTLVRELGLRQAAKWYSARRPDSPYAQRAISS